MPTTLPPSLLNQLLKAGIPREVALKVRVIEEPDCTVVLVPDTEGAWLRWGAEREREGGR